MSFWVATTGHADGPGKFMAQREVAQAQDAMLNGKMNGCAMHLGRAMQAGSLTQALYGNAQTGSRRLFDHLVSAGE